MALTPMADFTFKHANQPDQVSGDPATYKANMDSQANHIRGYINDTLKPEVDSLINESYYDLVLVTEPYNQTTKTTVVLGIEPKYIHIKASIADTKYESDGYATALNGPFICYRNATSGNASITGAAVVRFEYDASNYLTGTLAFTETGLEITWSLTGTLTGASGNRRLIISAPH